MTTATGSTIDPAILGVTAGPVRHALDARWLMAYAAGLGETDVRAFDTLRASGPVAHPLFPVCYEWPVAVALRDATVAAHLQPQSVHATHHLVLHRMPRAGDTLSTTGRVIAVVPRRAGTLVVSRFETVDARGEPVSTTDYGSVYRGVALQQPGHPPAGTGAPAGDGRSGGTGAASAGAVPVEWSERVEVAANAALVYTECARIWNPIHTDVAVARRAGLSGPILHGTATLALAVSRVVARELGGDASRVREIRGRFTGMVPLPSTLVVRGHGGLTFDAVASDGASILSEGALSA